MRGIFRSAWQRVVSCFLAGLFAVLPLVITVAIVAWVTGFVEELIGPQTVLGGQLRSVGLQFVSNTAVAYIVGWVLVLATIFVLGVVVELGMRKLVQRGVDAVLRRVPLVGSVYHTARQLVDMIDRKDQAELEGMSVVFCVFGGANGSGVLALMPSPERFCIDGRQYHVVIIPTAPVPVGGGLLFVPVDSVRPADMSVDGLMSIYMSMGVTVPQFLAEDGSATE